MTSARGSRARLLRERGQATVELALLLPVVALLLLTVLQVGLVARDALLVAHAAREAARAAAVDASPGAARAAALASSGLDPDRLVVAVSGGGSPGTRIRVDVSYRAAHDLPMMGVVIGERVVRASATMRVEHPDRPPSVRREPREGPQLGQIAEKFWVSRASRGRIWQPRKRT